MLKIGDKAPVFKLSADNGKTFSLSDFKGKTLILYFYPKDLTSGCTQEACDFRDLQSAFKKKKGVVVGVSKDAIKKHLTFKEKYSLPFTLLSDEEGAACEAYGVWKEKTLYGRKYMGIERTTFVIGPTGKIENIYGKVKVTGHAKTVLEGLK